MAAEDHDANPIIVEPAASARRGTPPRLLAPSLNTSSSSDTSASSRPQSRGSNATSPSDVSSPAMSGVELHELANNKPLTAPDLEPLPPNSLPLLSERSRNRTTSSLELPSGRVYGRPSCRSICDRIFSRRRWLEHVLGVVTLVASLVGLLFVGVRTYKLAVISTENSTLDGCAALIQAGFTSIENSTTLCKKAMEKGPSSSPYHLGKRPLHSSFRLVSRLIKVPPEQTCGFPYIGCQPQEASKPYGIMSTSAIIISMTLVLGGLILTMARRNARSTEVFTSPARSVIHIIRRQDSGHTTAIGEGVIEEHDPEGHDDLGQMRERIRMSQSQDSLMKDTAPLHATDSSSTTSVSECKEAEVSLHNRSSGEKHEGLMEMQINRSTIAFYKIQTGEMFHLKHWIQHHDDSDSDSFSGSNNPVNIEDKDLGHKNLGAFVRARGKAAKSRGKREVQLWHKKGA